MERGKVRGSLATVAMSDAAVRDDAGGAPARIRVGKLGESFGLEGWCRCRGGGESLWRQFQLWQRQCERK